ncbi:MAG: putative transcriptional regulator [Acidobacteriales bacterium]|nr:putative transcriptional regulator [Terriglobales bacterium]
MIIQPISMEDAIKFCERPEDHFFDRKSLQIAPAKLLRHICAFANADSGELVIGIADDKEAAVGIDRWRGASDIEEFNGFFQALRDIQPSCTTTATFLVCVGLPGYVLHLAIEKDSFVHETPDGKVYQRVSAQSLPLSAQEIMDLTYAKGQRSFEDEKVSKARIEDIVDSEEVRSFLQDYSPKTDPLDFVVNQYLVDVRDWEPTVAGLLLFACNPSAVMPKQCAVKVARYETREDDAERDHLKETFTIEGPAYDVISQSVSKVKEIMSATTIWTMEGMRPVEYPPEAIQEIVTNAVIHRDYSISDHIHIYVFDNRIEVRSPGRLPGYITVQNILDARFSRNPKLVRTLARYKNPPNRDMGEGLNTAFQKMKEWKLKDPEISVEGSYVVVTIPHTPLGNPEEIVLKYLQKNPSIRNKEARDLTGIRSENSMKNVFIRLQQQGEIEPVPELKGSASRWRLKA